MHLNRLQDEHGRGGARSASAPRARAPARRRVGVDCRAAMVEVTNADRIVFPEVGRTKGDVVAYHERLGPRILTHVAERPLSLRRFPKGLAAPGFFQKNVPPHYPASIARFAVPRSRAASKRHARKGGGEEERDVTLYPIVSDPEHLAYLANQGVIELHVPTARAPELHRPDRLVVDLDPPPGALALVRRAALLVRDALADRGLPTVPVATGSKGYHVVAAVRPSASVDAGTLGIKMQKLAMLLAAAHPDELTTVFRVKLRGERVFVDWLRNFPSATVVAPFSLRARPRATVATPLAWAELETTEPDAFTIDDGDRLLERPDTLAELAAAPADVEAFVAGVDADFARSGMVVETFDRFRS
jgi:bifunctional non-homologous end joining protein LigD